MSWKTNKTSVQIFRDILGRRHGRDGPWEGHSSMLLRGCYTPPCPVPRVDVTYSVYVLAKYICILHCNHRRNPHVTLVFNCETRESDLWQSQVSSWETLCDTRCYCTTFKRSLGLPDIHQRILWCYRSFCVLAFRFFSLCACGFVSQGAVCVMIKFLSTFISAWMSLFCLRH